MFIGLRWRLGGCRPTLDKDLKSGRFSAIENGFGVRRAVLRVAVGSLVGSWTRKSVLNVAPEGQRLFSPGSQQSTPLTEVGGATSAALGRGVPQQAAEVTFASVGEVWGLTRQLERYDGLITDCTLPRGTTPHAFANGVWLQEAISPGAAPSLLPAILEAAFDLAATFKVNGTARIRGLYALLNEYLDDDVEETVADLQRLFGSLGYKVIEAFYDAAFLAEASTEERIIIAFQALAGLIPADRNVADKSMLTRSLQCLGQPKSAAELQLVVRKLVHVAQGGGVATCPVKQAAQRAAAPASWACRVDDATMQLMAVLRADGGPRIAAAVTALQGVMRGITLYAFDAATDSAGTDAAKAAAYHATKRKHNEESLRCLISELGTYQALPGSVRGQAEQQACAGDGTAKGKADYYMDTLSALVAGDGKVKVTGADSLRAIGAAGSHKGRCMLLGSLAACGAQRGVAFGAADARKAKSAGRRPAVTVRVYDASDDESDGGVRRAKRQKVDQKWSGGTSCPIYGQRGHALFNCPVRHKDGCFRCGKTNHRLMTCKSKPGAGVA
ncbi:hypothetical protein M885DRAFT_499943 [Pelagophyceae sp. CCMP2097]|nr:hypothetical protein M885DRAFT_499943 [Pelagophyceae sp. CCMP2097]